METQVVELEKGKTVDVIRVEGARKRRLRMPQMVDFLSPLKKRDLAEKGASEGEKALFKEKLLHEEMFSDVIKRANTVLFRAKTLFPFDLFPNDLIIDVTKVTLVTRSFFWSGFTQSIHIKDIMDVIVETGPFLSNLTILDLGYNQKNKLHVYHLLKKDAVRARQIIEGLIAASKAGVDLTKVGRQELLARLPELIKVQQTPLP